MDTKCASNGINIFKIYQSFICGQICDLYWRMFHVHWGGESVFTEDQSQAILRTRVRPYWGWESVLTEDQSQGLWGPGSGLTRTRVRPYLGPESVLTEDQGQAFLRTRVRPYWGPGSGLTEERISPYWGPQADLTEDHIRVLVVSKWGYIEYWIG